MTLVKWTPRRSLFNYGEDLWDNFFNTDHFLSRGRESWYPAVDIEEGKDNYHVTMELPGISRDDINLEATGDELWFSAHCDEFKKQYRHHLHFKKRIRPNEIKANLKAGILTITVPFADKVPKTKVDVE